MKTSSPLAAAIIPAAGRGVRTGGTVPKLEIPLLGIPVLVHTLRACEAAPAIDAVIVVTQPGKEVLLQVWEKEYGLTKVQAVVPGGANRQESVARGLAQVEPRYPVVLVHDGARPLVSPNLLDRAVAAAASQGSGVAAVPVIDTLKQAPDGQHVLRTVDRAGLWAVQTPQAFQRELLCQAHNQAAREGFCGTDEASLVERYGHTVCLIPGERTNLKITLPEDCIVAEALLRARCRSAPPPERSSRIGVGYDIHRLVPGRPLWLGGIHIPFPLGLAGHSDADALLHAIADAILGALNAGDIGEHFPDTDPQYKEAPSFDLLRQVAGIMHQEGYTLGNVDAVILAEAPRLAPYRAAMQQRIASALSCNPQQISLKATTLEGLGALGAGEGIAAQAVVSLYRV